MVDRAFFSVDQTSSPVLLSVVATLSFFFFQAEDGIRDYKVTGVQTCALPISPITPRVAPGAMNGRPASAGSLIAGRPTSRVRLRSAWRDTPAACRARARRR